MLRATDPKDRMGLCWMCDGAGTCCCASCAGVCPVKKTKPFALAEVSLTEAAVCWRDYATVADAQLAMESHCAVHPAIKASTVLSSLSFRTLPQVDLCPSRVSG